MKKVCCEAATAPKILGSEKRQHPIIGETNVFQKISTSTTLDFLEIYVTLLKFCEIFEMLYPVLYFVKFLKFLPCFENL